MSIVLKPHNNEAFEEVKEQLEQSNKTAVIQPMGTGKSFIALKLIEEYKDKKAIYIAPSNAILHTIKNHIFDSGMTMQDFPNLKRITYQKLASLSDEEIEKLDFDIIILDEFHHCGAPKWCTGVERLLDYNKNAKVLGLSATPIRYFDKLRDMAYEMFENNIASEMSLEKAITEGILPKGKYVCTLYGIDKKLEQFEERINEIENYENRVKAKKEFDYLREKIDENTRSLPDILAKYIVKKNGKGIIFCKNIEDMQEKMKQAQTIFGKINTNIKVYGVSSTIKNNEKILQQFEQNHDENVLKLMFAVDMLNEGYHIEDLDFVAMMRETYSPTLYMQQLGRGLTVGSKEPLIIDLVDNFDSIQIIEGMCERLQQYDSTGKHKIQNEDDSIMEIHDYVKDFRHIIKKITDLTYRNNQRKYVNLQDKIDLFEKYFLEGNDYIDGKTIFDGFPIGQWVIQIRSQIKRKDAGINITEEQIKKLQELGIMDIGIRSTIDEKIDSLIEWKSKYPAFKISKANANGTLSNKKINELRKIAQNRNIDVSKLEEEYRKNQRYYSYVIQRENGKKLSEEQRERCREANLSKKFGYSREVMKMSDKYKIDEETVFDIYEKYGSFEKFIKLYRDANCWNKEELSFVMDCNNGLITNFIDIDDNPYSRNYIKLLREVSSGIYDSNNSYNGLYIFSSKKIKEKIERLTPIEASVIKKEFGLEDSESSSIEDNIKSIDSKWEKIKIKSKALRKLLYRNNEEEALGISLKRLMENKFIKEEEKVELMKLEDEIWNSELIVQDTMKIESDEKSDREKLLSIRERLSKFYNIREELKNREQEARIQQDKEKYLRKFNDKYDNISIEEIGLSDESVRALRNIGINNIVQIIPILEPGSKKIDDILREEIINKVGDYMKENDERTTKRETTIEEMNLSTRTTKCLKRNNIHTLDDLMHSSQEELLRIRAFGKKSFEEISNKMKELEVTFISDTNIYGIRDDESDEKIDENNKDFEELSKEELERIDKSLEFQIQKAKEEIKKLKENRKKELLTKIATHQEELEELKAQIIALEDNTENLD